MAERSRKKKGTAAPRKRSFVPRLIFGTAVVGVVPACVVAGCSSGTTTGGSGKDSGLAQGVAAIGFDGRALGVADAAFNDRVPLGVADIGFDARSTDGPGGGDGAAGSGDDGGGADGPNLGVANMGFEG